jgi:hypothetical protein
VLHDGSIPSLLFYQSFKASLYLPLSCIPFPLFSSTHPSIAKDNNLPCTGSCPSAMRVLTKNDHATVLIHRAALGVWLDKTVVMTGESFKLFE